MRITVFGATGSVGRLVVEQALAQGHEVTAFTRDAARVPDRSDRLRVVEGDVADPTACAEAVAGTNAVIVTLGDGRTGRVREEGTRAVVAAMRQAGVRRLVCQTSLGVGASWSNLNPWWKYVMFGALLRRTYADHVRQEAVVRESDTDWTIVRPSAFVAERPGAVRIGFGGSEPGLRLKIARADLAAFLLAQTSDRTCLRRAVAISS